MFELESVDSGNFCWRTFLAAPLLTEDAFFVVVSFLAEASFLVAAGFLPGAFFAAEVYFLGAADLVVFVVAAFDVPAGRVETFFVVEGLVAAALDLVVTVLLAAGLLETGLAFWVCVSETRER